MLRWLPEGFVHPERVELATGHHLRPIRADDVALDYALLDAAETELLGCVYIDPPTAAGTDAAVSWWVVDKAAGSELELALDAFVPLWLEQAWGFRAVDYSP